MPMRTKEREREQRRMRGGDSQGAHNAHRAASHGHRTAGRSAAGTVECTVHSVCRVRCRESRKHPRTPCTPCIETGASSHSTATIDWSRCMAIEGDSLSSHPSSQTAPLSTRSRSLECSSCSHPCDLRRIQGGHSRSIECRRLEVSYTEVGVCE